LDFTPLVRDTDAAADAGLALLPDDAVIETPKPPSLLDQSADEFDDFSLILSREGASTGPQAGPVMHAGQVDAQGAVVRMRYDDLGGLVTLHDLVVYNAPCAAGDSGAAVFVRDSGALAGIHVGALTGDAGGSASAGLMTPIRTVFSSLQIPFSLDSIATG